MHVGQRMPGKFTYRPPDMIDHRTLDDTTRTVPTLQLRLIMESFKRKMQQIALKSNKLSIDWQPVIAVNSLCQGVDRCSAQVCVYSVEQ